ITSIAVDFPGFREGAERDAGVVLNDDATVLEEKIAYAGETFAVHQIRGRLEKTQAGPLLGAPAQEPTFAARKIGLEVIQSLDAARVLEVDFHSFRRRLNVGGVMHRAAAA